MKRLIAAATRLQRRARRCLLGRRLRHRSVPPTSPGFNGNPGGSTPPPQPAPPRRCSSRPPAMLPYPTDLYFAGSTDGTLNIQPANALMPNQAAINALDGYLDQRGDPRALQRAALNPATLTAASVIVLPVITDNLTKATIGVAGPPLTPGVDYTVAPATEPASGRAILEITPLHPLTPEHLHRQRPVPRRQLRHRQRLPRDPDQRHQGRRRQRRAAGYRLRRASSGRGARRPAIARASPTRP